MESAGKKAAGHHIHPDFHQILLLLICTFDLGFFLYYLFAYNLKEQNTISDALFSYPEYVVVLTVLLACRTLAVALYFGRYRNANPEWVGIGLFFIGVTLFGWGWLAAHKQNIPHFTGVFLFCLGSFSYALVMLRLCKESHPHLSQQHFWLETFIFVSSGILVITFVTLWVLEELDHKHDIGSNDRTQQAYIVEHCAYISNLLFFAGFFLFHTPDPMKPPHIEAEYNNNKDNQAHEMKSLLLKTQIVIP